MYVHHALVFLPYLMYSLVVIHHITPLSFSLSIALPPSQYTSHHRRLIIPPAPSADVFQALSEHDGHKLQSLTKEGAKFGDEDEAVTKKRNKLYKETFKVNSPSSQQH